MKLNNTEPAVFASCLLDLGEKLLYSGAEVNRVEDTLRRMAVAYGASNSNVFVITASISLTLEVDGQAPISQTRRIPYSAVNNFTMLENLNALSRKCCSEDISLEEFRKELKQAEVSPRAYLWILGGAIGAAAFAMFFGGTLLDALVSFLFGLLICFSQKFLSSYFPNNTMFNLFCSFTVGLLICLTAKLIPALNMDMIMIGDIMLLIPGLAITNAVRDMLVGDTISGSMRLIESLLWAGALACGFVAAISVVM